MFFRRLTIRRRASAKLGAASRASKPSLRYGLRSEISIDAVLDVADLTDASSRTSRSSSRTAREISSASSLPAPRWVQPVVGERHLKLALRGGSHRMILDHRLRKADLPSRAPV